MKKLFLILLAMTLALTGLTAFAEEEAAPSPTADELANIDVLAGFVMDMTDEFILIQTPDGMYVEALLTENTLTEGKDVQIGDLIHVTYNGMMTRSIPAQIIADHIGCYMAQGVVSDLTETGFVLILGEDALQVNAESDQLTAIQDGMFVTVYHNGAMTMSIPAQVSASHIRGTEIIGVVTEMVEDGFTLTVEGEEIPYHVAVQEDARIFVQAEPGMEVIVVTDGLQTASLESILVNAVEVLPLPTAAQLFDMAGIVTEITEEFILIETADGQLTQVNLFEETLSEGKEIEVGDYIHVTFNGQMTFSIPAQIAALKVGCYTHTGVVSDIGEGQFVLTTELEPIIVSAPADMLANLSDGMTVTVYSNGTMTMSLPAQIGAEMITATETIVD